jgi:hypothetical protein
LVGKIKFRRKEGIEIVGSQGKVPENKNKKRLV